MTLLTSVNLWAVLVATVASFLLGWLWYGPLFGKSWMKLSGVTPKSIKTQMSPTTSMILGFVSMFVVAWALAQFINLFGAGTLVGSLKVGFWLWLGFVATTTLGSFLWEGKSFNLWLFNNVYNLVNILIMSAILSYW